MRATAADAEEARARVPSLRQLAAGTPATRHRSIDALRALAIVAVVLGHWLLMDVVRLPDGLTGETALGYLGDVHWLTWIFQVMPLFFLVAGFSNAISWTRHQERGQDAATWLLGRSSRVFTPLTLLLALMATAAFTAGRLGASEFEIAQAVSVVVLPLWFMVVYLAVLLLTPLLFRLHRRVGLWALAGALLGVLIGDVLRFSTGIEYTAGANFAFAWAGIHQVGFAWQDGRLDALIRRPWKAWALAAVGLAGAWALTVPGPYPTSMVSIPGAPLQNSGPPSLALVSLATAQIAVALAVSCPLDRLLRRSRRLWALVIGLNAVIMTLYLWHMVAGFFGAMIWDALGLLPQEPSFAERALVPGTATWWWQRIAWVATLSVVIAVVIAAVGWVERRSLTARLGAPPARAGEVPRPARGRRWWLTAAVIAYLSAVFGMYWQASAGRGPHGPFTVPTGALTLTLVASATLWGLRRADARRA